MDRFKEEQANLQRQLSEAEQHNESLAALIERTKRMIQRARLERAILHERLELNSGLAQHPELAESPPPSPPLMRRSERPKEEGRKRAAPRDPRLPKRPQNAYLLFCENEKDRIKQELESKESTEASSQNLSKAMTEAWKSLGNTGRKKYHDLYQADRLRYVKEMAQFPSAGLSPTDQKEKQRAVKHLKQFEENGNINPDEEPMAISSDQYSEGDTEEETPMPQRTSVSPVLNMDIDTEVSEPERSSPRQV